MESITKPVSDATVSRQSVPWIDWAHTPDAKQLQSVVVVGSGYGGAVAALRYAEKGYAVTVLERGAEFLPGEFSNDISTLPKFLRGPSLAGKTIMGSATGLFDFRLGQGATAVVANGLGGGSLINAGVAIEPNPAVLSQDCWPQSIRADALNLPSSHGHSLRKAYDLAYKTLKAKRWTEQSKKKTNALGLLAGSLSAANQFKPVDLTIDSAKCTRCGDCAAGCNIFGAKLTLGQTYLAEAMKTGRVRILTRATVLRLTPTELNDPTTNWILRVLPTEEIGFWPTRTDADKQAGFDLHTAAVVLSAGTLGSTEILQRSKAYLGDKFAISPSLGNRFSANGDNISFLADTPSPVMVTGQGLQAGLQSPSVQPCGPTITGMIDLRHNAPTAVKGGPGLEREMLIQDGAIPGAIARLFREALSTAYAARQLSNWTWCVPKSLDPANDPLAASQGLADHTQVLLTMGHDQAAGRIVRVEGRDESVPFWPNAADAPGYVAQQNLFDRIPKKQGLHLYMPTWRFFGSNSALDRLAAMPPMVTTVHPLGGCAMGDFFETSVVDDQGRVRFAEKQIYLNLRVLDASIIPTSLGANPFLTIAALAERSMTFVTKLQTPQVHHPPIVSQTAIPMPVAPQYAPQPISASITEAQDCKDFLVRGDLAAALGVNSGEKVIARFELTTKDADWLKLWDDAAHTLTSFNGGLTLTTVAGNKFDWRLDTCAGTFILLPAAKSVGAFKHAMAFLRCACTWLIVRYSFTQSKDRSRPEATFASGHWVTRNALDARNFFAGALTLWHASEERDMRYIATLNGTVSGTAQLPDLKLVGIKHVAYAATCKQLMFWSFKFLKFKFPLSSERPTRFDLRKSFWEQVTNPRIKLYAASSSGGFLDRKLGQGEFEMDIPNLLKGGWFDSAPLLLKDVSDLASGLQALAAYPALFSRFALKTRIAEVQIPDYGHEAVDDSATPEQVELRINQPAGEQVAQKQMAHPQPSTFTQFKVTPEKYALVVPRGATTIDNQLGEMPDNLTLALWRYRRPESEGGKPAINKATWHDVPVRKAKSILMLHAFAQSGYTFTNKSMPQNMAEVFYQDGWEVWVLDHRISTRLGYAELPSTIDQVGQIDVAAAVDRILSELRSDLDSISTTEVAPLQIHVFAQCIGAASLAVGLLSGRLHYSVSSPSFSVAVGSLSDNDLKTAEDSQLSYLPKLASAVISQTHPFLVGTKITQAKIWVPGLIRSAFNRFSVAFATRGPVTSLLDKVADTLFASLPVPAVERCPAQKDYKLYESACVTCKRIRFIEAPLFKHSNLSDVTHEDLPLLFGPANVHLFAQAGRMVKQERLCSEDGFNVYANLTNLRKYAALPIVFMHGLENELFDAEGAQRSAKRHFDAHPQWACLAAAALPNVGGGLGSRVMDAGQASNTYNYWWIKGYGHLDPIIGKQAPIHVFAPLCNWYSQMQKSTGAGLTAPEVAPMAIAKPPRCGPFMSNVRLEGVKLKLTVSFLIDDLHQFGGDVNSTNVAGQRVWAIAAVQGGDSFRLLIQPYLTNSKFFADIADQMALNRYRGTATPPGGARSFVPSSSFEAYSMACGDIEIEQTSLAQISQLVIDCFTVHEVLQHPEPKASTPVIKPATKPAVFQPLSAAHITNLNLSLSTSSQVAQATSAFCKNLLVLTLQRSPASPSKRPSVSALRGRLQKSSDAQLTLQAAAWRSLAADSSAVSFIATCCRYPSYGVDAVRAKEFADDNFKRLIGSDKPAFALMVGDQIYADFSGGLVDPLSPVERFYEKHVQAFGHANGMGDWLAQLPTYMTPDDHEFIESYPNGRPITMAASRAPLVGSDPADNAARDAVNAFQLLQQPPRIGSSASYTFSHGPARFFVLDTRTERTEDWLMGPTRQPSPGLLAPATLHALKAWLNHADSETHLNCLVTGSVLVPGLAQGSNPAYAGRPDNWQSYPAERAMVMAELSALGQRGGRFLLLSGDYHVSAACEIFDKKVPDKPIGAALVVPPLYAPISFLNASAHDVWMDEPLSFAGSGWILNPTAVSQPGSGIATISVERGLQGGYTITVMAQLTVWEAGTAPLPWTTSFNL